MSHCMMYRDKLSETFKIEAAHTDWINSITILDHLGLIATGSSDKIIKLWDLNAQMLRSEHRGHTKGIFSMTYSPEYRLMFSAGEENDVYVWNPFIGNIVKKLQGHDRYVTGVCAIPGTPHLVTTDKSGVVCTII